MNFLSLYYEQKLLNFKNNDNKISGKINDSVLFSFHKNIGIHIEYLAIEKVPKKIE